MTTRAYRKGIDLVLFGGLTTATVDLFAAARSDRGVSYKLVCPDPAHTEDGSHQCVKLEQRYVCPEDDSHGPYARDEAARAEELGKGKDKTLALVTAEEIEAVKDAGMPVGRIEVHAFRREDLAAHTRPAGSLYRLEPEKDKSGTPVLPQLVAMLADLAQDPEIALVGEAPLDSSAAAKMWELTTWRGALFLQELIRPDDLNEFDQEEVTYVSELLEKCRTFAHQNVETFEPEAWRNQLKERAHALAEQKAANPDAVVSIPRPDKPAADPLDGLLGALDASIKQAKKK